MATVYFNKKVSGTGCIWTAKNGATRRTLCLILNDEDFAPIEETDEIKNVKLRWMDKGNHSFIFINATDKQSDTKVGVFLNSEYGYTCHTSDKELYSNSSVGGPGNSESKFGVYKLGAIIEEHTYKNRRPSSYWYLTKNGWKYLGTEANILANLNDYYCKRVAEHLNLIPECNLEEESNCVE